MLNAKFCLCPSGTGFGWRTYLAAIVGCIPVIVQPLVQQAYADLLPYRHFALTFSMADVKRLPNLLQGIPTATLCRLRHGGARYARMLSWQQPGGLAYDMLQLSLCRRAVRVHSEFRGDQQMPAWAACARMTADELLNNSNSIRPLGLASASWREQERRIANGRSFRRGRCGKSALPGRPGRSAAVVFAMGAGKACPWLPSFVAAIHPTAVHLVTGPRGMRSLEPQLRLMRAVCYAPHINESCAMAVHRVNPFADGGNGARECGCFLHFLLTMRSRMPDDVLFMHDSVEQVDLLLLRRALQSPMRFAHVLDERRALFKCFPTASGATTSGGRLDLKVQGLFRSLAVYAPRCVVVPCCAMFKVTREAVLSRPPSLYSVLNQFVQTNGLLGQTACHGLEFVWHIVFGAQAWLHPLLPDFVMRDGLQEVAQAQIRDCGPGCVAWDALNKLGGTIDDAKAAVQEVPQAAEVPGHLCRNGKCRHLKQAGPPFLKELSKGWAAAIVLGNRSLTPRDIYAMGLRRLRRTLAEDPGCDLRSSVDGPQCHGTSLFEDSMTLRMWAA